MSKYQLICITGPDGSGKSTLIDAVKDQLPDSVVVSIWDLIKDPNMQNIVPFKKPEEIDIYLSHLHHKSRSLFLMHCLTEAMEMARKKNASYILTDSYWYKYYATEIAHGTPSDYLDKLISLFEKPDFIFYINALEKLTAKRKKSFSRYECGFARKVNEQTFMDFQRLAILNLQKLMATMAHKILDASLPASENSKIILKELNHCIE